MYDYHFFIFILLFLFSILLIIFNSFVDRSGYVDLLSWLLAGIPVIGFVYLLKFPRTGITQFYVLFSAFLVAYVVVFAGERIYSLFM